MTFGRAFVFLKLFFFSLKSPVVTIYCRHTHKKINIILWFLKISWKKKLKLMQPILCVVVSNIGMMIWEKLDRIHNKTIPIFNKWNRKKSTNTQRERERSKSQFRALQFFSNRLNCTSHSALCAIIYLAII